MTDYQIPLIPDARIIGHPGDPIMIPPTTSHPESWPEPFLLDQTFTQTTPRVTTGLNPPDTIELQPAVKPMDGISPVPQNDPEPLPPPNVPWPPSPGDGSTIVGKIIAQDTWTQFASRPKMDGQYLDGRMHYTVPLPVPGEPLQELFLGFVRTMA